MNGCLIKHQYEATILINLQWGTNAHAQNVEDSDCKDFNSIQSYVGSKYTCWSLDL